MGRRARRAGLSGASPEHERIYAVVNRIPRGRVATYGQVAALAGLPRRARMVGRALSVLPEDRDVAWHRVVNASGGISARGEGHHETVQRVLLEREGVVFGRGGRVDLDRFRWRRGAGPPRALERGPRPATMRATREG